MIKRWYISTFVIILTLLGGVCQQQITIPNQEIVLQFTDVEVTSEDTQSTIAIVKKQLQDIGVHNIQVKEEENGTLKITYYSATDIASIKKTFSKDKTLNIDYTSHNQGKESSEFPFGENTISYNLDVYEIQSGSDTGWDFNGISVLEFKSKSDRLFDPNPYTSTNNINARKDDCLVQVAYIIHRNIAIAIDNTSRSIPEVRAGPTC